ncbi:cytochrome P450 [Streptomyces sp. NPDC003006]
MDPKESFVMRSTSRILSEVFAGSAEFRNSPAEYYRELSGSQSLVWFEDLESWVCLSSDVSLEVLRNAERYPLDPHWEDGAHVPDEARVLRRSWLEFSAGSTHRAIRGESSAAVSRSREGWHTLEESVDRIIDEIPDSSKPLDLVSALVEPLWDVLLRDWVGLDDELIRTRDEWIPAAVSVVNGMADSHQMAGTSDVMKRIGKLIRVSTGSSDARLLGALAKCEGGDLSDTAAAARAINIIVDATPLPQAVVLCLREILADEAARRYMAGQLDAAASVDPGGFRRGIAELLRRNPVQTFAVRFSVEEHMLGGKSISASDRLIVLIGSANNDPLVHDRPEEFNPDRESSGAAPFGFGPHSCLGRSFTMDFLVCAVRSLLARFPYMSLAGKELWIEGTGLNQLERCPVSLHSED